MRLMADLEVALGPDNDLLRKVIDENVSVDDTDLTTHVGGQTVIAISGTLNVAFGGVTRAKYLLVLAYSEVTVTLDGADTSHTLKPHVAAAAGAALSTVQRSDRPGVLWISGCDLTSVTIINPSGAATATVFVALAGEQT